MAMKRTKKLTMYSIMLLTVALMTISCQSEIKVFSDSPMVTQVRQIKGFERVEIVGSPTVYYQQGDTYSVKVKGPEDLVDKIVTEKEDETLIIRNKGKFGIVNINMMGNDQLEVHVTSPDLIGVQLNGSGDFISHQRIDTDNMEITLRGSGDIDISDLICDHCVIEMVGSGDLDIDRLETRTSEVSLVGSGDVELKQVNVRSTDITLRGSGDISVDFMEGCHEVQANLTGSGDVTLKGHVGKYSQQKSGAGDIDTNHLTVE
jgi:hypothetical protein